jgi:hypothetical protein
MSSLGFAWFEEAGAIYAGTRVILTGWVQADRLTDDGAAFLAVQTLPALELTEAGVIAGSRTEMLDQATAATLVKRAGISAPPTRDSAEAVAAAIEHAMLSAGGPVRLTHAGEMLNWAAHAAFALAAVPFVPATSFSYPYDAYGLRSYRDLTPPRHRGEFVERVEELERVIHAVATRRAAANMDGPSLRRAFGFLDAAAWIATDDFRLAH